MKKFFACTKTAVALLIVAILSFGFYVYMLARPISYGMSYHNETTYQGDTFEGTMTFSCDGTLVIRNTTFEEEIESYYYYKDGYVFFLAAQTEEAREEEIAYIDNNFDVAVREPFYSAETSASKQIHTGPDGYTTVYTCKSASVFALAYGIFELALVGLTLIAFALRKKEND